MSFIGELRTERFGILKLHDKTSYEIALKMLAEILKDMENNPSQVGMEDVREEKKDE